MSGNKLELSDAFRKIMALLLATTTTLGPTALPVFAASKPVKAATAAPATALPGLNPANTHALGRCGYGARQPLLVISPWAKQNFVDHTVTDQTSIIRFVEDNWLSGQRIGQGSFDGIASSISRMFNFTKIRNNGTLFLNASNGERE